MKFFFTFCSLFIFVSSFDEYSTDPEEFDEKTDLLERNTEAGNKTNTIGLYRSQNGMYFSKKNLRDGLNIIYDCSLDFVNEGTIIIMDQMHPEHMNSLTVENCKNISVKVDITSQYNRYEYFQKPNIKNLIIKNISTVTIEMSPQNIAPNNNQVLISISNVKNLMLNRNYFFKRSSLHLSNVGMDVFSHNNQFPFSNVKMSQVHIKNVETNAIACKGGSKGVFSVKNSHFENVEPQGFSILNASRVEFQNNTFINLESEALKVEALQDFIFSDNCVKAMKDSFHVESPYITFTGNTILYQEESLFSKLLVRGPGNFPRTLNVSRNRMDIVPRMLELHSNSTPDLIVLKNNSLNCSCGNLNFFQYTTTGNQRSVLAEIFMNEKNENLCSNFGNCPVHKLKNKAAEVCSHQFVCPEFEDPPTTLNDILKLMSLSLHNLTDTLHLLMDELNAMRTSRTDLAAAESRAIPAEN